MWKASKVIVMGDFNKKWIGEVTEFLKKYDVQPILSDEQPTHRMGNTLDQIFTNMPCLSNKVTDVGFSDHFAISAKLQLTVDQKDLKLSKVPTYLSQGCIRSEATSQQTKEMLIANTELLNNPLINSIKDKLPRKKVISHWYQQAPKWYLFKEDHSDPEMKQGRDIEWDKLMKQIEDTYYDRDYRSFYKLVKKATKIKKSGQPLNGIEVAEQQILDKPQVEVEVQKFYQEVYSQPIVSSADQMELQRVTDCDLTGSFFNSEEVDEAISQCNFQKGIGPDGFDGRVLEDIEVREKVSEYLLECLNSGTFPDYFNTGRLVLLSKKPTKDIVPLEETRPIVVNSHLYKICEQIILNKLKATGSRILETPSYQTGFKSDSCTHVNISKLLDKIISTRRKKGKGGAFIMVDFRKAYDSIYKHQMIKALGNKCQSDSDRQLVRLISSLIQNNKLRYGDQTIDADRGVVQGGILSPFLFNVYLDVALNSERELKVAVQSGKLLAFADDILMIANDEREFHSMVSSLERLEQAFGLRLNRSKTFYLSDNPQMSKQNEILGIKRVNSVKYLGMEISLDKSKIIHDAKMKVKCLMEVFKRRVKIQDPSILNSLYTSYLRSLIVFFYTPLVTVGLSTAKQVSMFEAQVRRNLLRVPNDIKSQFILNVTANYEKSTAEVVEKLSQKIELKAFCQTKLPYKASTTNCNEPPRRIKIYIQKDILDLMLAVSQNRTVLNYGYFHYCRVHQTMVDKNHIHTCDLINGMGSPTQFNQKLLTTSIYRMEQSLLVRITMLFGWLKVKLQQLEDDGSFVVIKKYTMGKQIYMRKHPQNGEAMCIE